MKVFVSTIIIIFFACFGVHAQNATTNKNTTFPSIATLTTWSSYNSQTKFDLQIRSFGFKFEEKIAAQSSTSYTYIRKVTTENINYTDRIVYRIANNHSASIISLVTASNDLVSFYTPQLASFKNRKCENEMSKDKNTSCSCYENANFEIDLCDERVKLTMGDGNNYFISVAKK
jgi:hypothetical protein